MVKELNGTCFSALRRMERETKEMWCQYIHILRVAVFHHAPSSSETDLLPKETGSSSVSGQQLAVAIYSAFPGEFLMIFCVLSIET